MKKHLTSVFINLKKFLQLPAMRIYLPIVTLACGTLIGVYLTDLYHVKDISKEIRANKSSFKYINPLLECEGGTFHDSDNLELLKRDITTFSESKKNEGSITFASMYYRDLNNGPSFGIDSDEKFSPASLIKVPLMIAYYRIAESKPDILEEKITVSKDVVYDQQNIIPKVPLEKGKSYTVEELIERMIIYSDNISYDILLNHIGNDQVVKVYNDMGIDIAKANTEDPDGDIITVKAYSSFFRVLFNSSYLSPEKSERVLALMTKTQFQDGLVAGVDPSVQVSHKYGERFYTFSGIRQLHDCGIVYHPKGPYLLCIMTRGSNLDDLSKYIKSVSEMVYEKTSEK